MRALNDCVHVRPRCPPPIRYNTILRSFSNAKVAQDQCVALGLAVWRQPTDGAQGEGALVWKNSYATTIHA